MFDIIQEKPGKIWLVNKDLRPIGPYPNREMAEESSNRLESYYLFGTPVYFNLSFSQPTGGQPMYH